jgi:tetratricopeptide (TPR) repeat protein
MTTVRSAKPAAMRRNLFAASLLSALTVCAIWSSAFAAAEEKPATTPPATPAAPAADEATSRKNFATDYEAGVTAVSEKNWTLARSKFTSALKSLGDYNDVKKSTAQVLLNKAERALIKDDAMFTASELLKLKQWVEAEEAFRKVVDVSGETETLRKNVLACRAGLESESDDLRKATEFAKASKWKEAIEAYNKASDKLGGIRMIRDGLQAAQLGQEADELTKKADVFIKDKKWQEAFDAYKRIMQIKGETDEVKRGIAAAQAGYAEDHKGSGEKPLPLGPPDDKK